MLDLLVTNIKSNAKTVKVGILKNATGDVDDGAIYEQPKETIAEYAAKNEFGSARIPSRPFMRTTIKKQSSNWQNIVAHLIKESNLDIETVLTAIGERAAADVRDTIKNGKFVPNAPMTIELKRLKGRPNPEQTLIDSGNMISSIGYEVQK